MTTLNPRTRRDIVAAVGPLVGAMRDCVRSLRDNSFAGEGKFAADNLVYGVTVRIEPCEDMLGLYRLTVTFRCLSIADAPIPFLDDQEWRHELFADLADMVNSDEDGRQGWKKTDGDLCEKDMIGYTVIAPTS